MTHAAPLGIFIGVDPGLLALINPLLTQARITSISDFRGYEQLMENGWAEPIGFIVCSNGIPEVVPIELAQSLRMQFSSLAVFYVTDKREGYERKNFIKNGFNDAFILPFDLGVIEKTFSDLLKQLTSSAPVYRSVKLVDVQPNTALKFDVALYMPVNKKYIKYVAAGDSLEKEQVERLQKHKVSNIFVPKEQMAAFYEYTAIRLKDLTLNEGQKFSETERKERLEGAVRELIGGMFNVGSSEATIEQGRMMVSDCQKIITSYIIDTTKSDWYAKLIKAYGNENDAYSHASSVSTYAALFSMGLQLGKPEDLATAGLLHDVGMADVPIAIQNKDPAAWTPDEKKLYQLHTEVSVKLMKEKKLIVPPIVMTAVLQHHERFDGTGYPKGMAGSRISIEGQILGIADEFDYLTCLRPDGSKGLTPKKAIENLMNRPAFNRDLVKQLDSLFPSDAV